MIGDGFAAALRAGRDDYNARFAEARRRFPGLDAGAFADFLRGTVDPWIRAVETVRPDRVPDVLDAAYDLGLDLVGQTVLGHGARHPVVEEGWRRLAEALARLAAEAPSRLLAAVTNALHLLAGTPGARPEEWLAGVEALGPRCADPETLLAVGQVLGWRAGLAHFRSGALAMADRLPPKLAVAAVGGREGASWTELRARLAESPWFDPSTDDPGARAGLREVARAGSFRGLGGLFAEPPLVAAEGELLLVRSGEEAWLLTADRFGATFHRASAAEFDAAARGGTGGGALLRGSAVHHRGASLDFASLAPLTSAAATRDTLAVTSAMTHAVILVALG